MTILAIANNKMILARIIITILSTRIQAGRTGLFVFL
jgi:hypothetical protein